MEIIKELRETIDREIEKMGFNKREPAELYRPVDYILSNGGKRIRPVIALMACRIFSDDITDCLGPALAIELFHNFTLLHDDIMDRADMRRGKLTVHKKWDENTAILSGDAMVVLSFELISSSRNDILKNLLGIFNKTAIEICEGQQMDMNFEKTAAVDEKAYMKMIKLKTSVLIAAAMQIGALAGGAADRQGEMMYSAGLNLGLAFQLQDDLLDLYGNMEDFGKKPGGDIIMNKKTILLIRALELAGPEIESEIFSIMEQENDTTKKVQDMKRIFDSLGVEKDVRKRTSYHFKSAVEVLNKAGGNPERIEELIGLIEKVASRKS